MKNKSYAAAALSIAVVAGSAMFVAPAANAQVSVGIEIGVPPPQPYYEVAPPDRIGYIWVQGFWGWDGYRYVWYEGHWEPERVGYVYRPAHWDRDGDYWRFREAFWYRGDRDDGWEHDDYDRGHGDRESRYYNDYRAEHYDHGRGRDRRDEHHGNGRRRGDDDD